MTTVRIERIAAGGDGVGRLEDGMTVFVPRTAPGDLAGVQVTERKHSYARGRLTTLSASGTGRTRPRCPHYTVDRCGGCQLQHLDPEAQLEAKRRIVGDALRRIARLDVADPPIVAAPSAWRYRRKITLAVRGDTIGLHPYDDAARVFPLDDCLITAEPLMDLWRRLLVHRGHLPAGAQAVVLRLDRDGGRHAIVRGRQEARWDGAALVGAVALEGVTFWSHPRGGTARVVGGPRSRYPAAAFEQVNSVFAARVRDDALAALNGVGGSIVWDLYSGVGDAAVRLAASGAEVWAVERDRAAVGWARRRSGGGTVHWVTGRVEATLSRLPHPGAVLVNPPRAGLAHAVARHLARWAAEAGTGAARRMVYISCDPATLARDLARLAPLQPVAITAYDLFPQTSHVEAVAVLEAA